MPSHEKVKLGKPGDAKLRGLKQCYDSPAAKDYVFQF